MMQTLFLFKQGQQMKRNIQKFHPKQPLALFFLLGQKFGEISGQMCFCSVISTKFVTFWEKVLQFLNFTKLKLIIINPWHLGLLLKCHIFSPSPPNKKPSIVIKIYYLFIPITLVHRLVRHELIIFGIAKISKKYLPAMPKI